MRILTVCIVLVCLLLAGLAWYVSLPANLDQLDANKTKFVPMTEQWYLDHGIYTKPADALLPENGDYG